MIKRVLSVAVSLVLTNCSAFNFPGIDQDRLLVASTGSNVVKIYKISASTGALISEQSISATSPSLVAGHPTSGAFLIHRSNTHVDCYRYSYRTNTGPTLESTWTSGALTALVFSPDGGAILYGKSADATLYLRTVSDCSLGNEVSVSRSGRFPIDYIDLSSDGTTGILYESNAGLQAWHFTRNVASNSVSMVKALTVTSASGYQGSLITPSGTYVLSPTITQCGSGTSPLLPLHSY